MATSIRMPRMGANMEEGTIVKWLKAVGDSVAKDEPLLEIETDKITVEVPAPVDGLLIAVQAGEAATVPVGAVIGTIGSADEARVVHDQTAAAAAPAAPAAVAATVPVKSRAEAQPSQPENGTRKRISPYAKRLAQSLGVDYHVIQGTGPSGRIVRKDIEQAVEEGKRRAMGTAAAAPAPLITAGASRIRIITAARMMDSLRTTAQLTLTIDADITRAEELRTELVTSLGKDGPPITVTALVIKAAALALRQSPEMMQRWDEQGLHAVTDVNIGMAVALEAGLVVPVMRSVDSSSLLQIGGWIKGATGRARSGNLTPDDMSGGCFTVSNLGSTPITYFTPILNPGEPGILGLGRSEKRAVVVDDKVAVRLMLPMSLTWDHRVLDGLPAARFAAAIKDLLENPVRLIAG